MTMYVAKRFPSLVEAVLEKRRLEQMEAARGRERVHHLPDEYRYKQPDTLPRKREPFIPRPFIPDPKVVREIEQDLYEHVKPKPKRRKRSRVTPPNAVVCEHCLKQCPYELHELDCPVLTGK